jgi:hypothetical protein
MCFVSSPNFNMRAQKSSKATHWRLVAASWQSHAPCNLSVNIAAVRHLLYCPRLAPRDLFCSKIWQHFGNSTKIQRGITRDYKTGVPKALPVVAAVQLLRRTHCHTATDLLLLPPLHFGSFLTASLSWFWFRAVLCRYLVLYACTVCLVTRLFAGWLGSSPYLDWLCSPSRVLTVRSISQCQKLTAHPRLVLTLMRGAVVYLHFPIHLHEVMLSWVPGKQLWC